MTKNYHTKYTSYPYTVGTITYPIHTVVRNACRYIEIPHDWLAYEAFYEVKFDERLSESTDNYLAEKVPNTRTGKVRKRRTSKRLMKLYRNRTEKLLKRMHETLGKQSPFKMIESRLYIKDTGDNNYAVLHALQAELGDIAPVHDFIDVLKQALQTPDSFFTLNHIKKVAASSWSFEEDNLLRELYKPKQYSFEKTFWSKDSWNKFVASNFPGRSVTAVKQRVITLNKQLKEQLKLFTDPVAAKQYYDTHYLRRIKTRPLNNDPLLSKTREVLAERIEERKSQT